MENTAKALIMVAGLLISIMVASFMVFMLRKAGQMSAEYDSQLSDMELVKFNSQFEAYAKDDNTLFDIITVANLAYDVNKRNDYDPQNSVEIRVENENNRNVEYSILSNSNLEKHHFFMNEDTTNQKYVYELVPEYGTQENQENPKYKYLFKCIETKYNNVTGKIEKMRFKIRQNN